MKARWLLVIAIASVAIAGRRCRHDEPPPLRIATFNIEDFPKTSRQIDGAFAELARLPADIVALQEITDPDLFAREAHARLGAQWDFVYTQASAVHTQGVLFDRSRYTLVSTAVHDETRLAEGRHKPTFEARLAPVAGGTIVRVLVVHLKAGGDGRAIRERQYRALRGVVATAMRSGDRVVLLGDFNATDDAGDRRDLAELARATGTRWASEGLACSAFWNRDDGCPRSRLDHVVAWTAPADVTAGGACATEGCAWQNSCPIYTEQVSDHCPVVATF
jgi:endonuclease/exonuclease/phosphatase family metal-dependent hydrolase